MEAFLLSASVVALAEMGDKTQLLAFLLAAKFKRRPPIVAGILLATLANHFLAGSVGVWAAGMLSRETLRWTVAGLFFAFGAWALVPDKMEENPKLPAGGVFVTTLVAFEGH